jgi:hypothetical protein
MGVAAGAIKARGEIAAATTDMAKSAAQTVAAVTTGVAPDESQDDAEGSNRSRTRRR